MSLRCSPPRHVVKVGGCGEGGDLFPRRPGVSVFASGPFPTCYQMSRSSTAVASKSGSLGAATGSAHVRKPNTAARAGRFQLQPCRQMVSQTTCLVPNVEKKKTNSDSVLFKILFSNFHHSLASSSTSADSGAPNSYFTFRDFSKVCVKFAW